MKRRSQLFGKTLFVDLMMDTLVVITALLMASNAIEKQTKQKKQAEESGLHTDGQYAIEMVWPDGSRDDVDLYVRDPNGMVAYYHALDIGTMHLEHDDQGTGSDNASLGFRPASNRHNQERVIIRETIPGEYVVNVHMFSKRDNEPTPVTIRLIRLKGEDTELVKKQRVLKRSGDESTAFRFTAVDENSVGNVNELPVKMTGIQAPSPNLFGPGGG
jgi:hypothetical protein